MKMVQDLCDPKHPYRVTAVQISLKMLMTALLLNFKVQSLCQDASDHYGSLMHRKTAKADF